MTQLLLTAIIAATLDDPLIDWRAEQTIAIFIWVLIIALAGIVGLFSRKLEYAIFFALVSSIISMAFFII